MNAPDRHIVVLGLMGAGKTTLGLTLAARYGLSYRDSDTDIEARTGRTGREIAATDGVPALHELEAAVLLDALAGEHPCVVSAAASTVERPACRAAIAEHAVAVWVDVPVDEIVARAATGSHRRPIDRRQLAERRTPLFREVATIRLDGMLDADAMADDVVRRLAGA